MSNGKYSYSFISFHDSSAFRSGVFCRFQAHATKLDNLAALVGIPATIQSALTTAADETRIQGRADIARHSFRSSELSQPSEIFLLDHPSTHGG